MSFQFSSRFFRFCCIGGIGFVIDSCLTYAFVALGAYSFVARVPAILVAMTVCYHFHYGFTFRKEGRAPLSGWYKFAITNGLGSLINYSSYAAILLFCPNVSLIVPLIVGAGAALAANYVMSVSYVFR